MDRKPTYEELEARVQDLEKSRLQLHRLKENLEDEKSLFRAIIDNIPVMITRYDPRAQLLFLNREFETKTGWTTEDARSINLVEKVYPDPEYRQKALDYMAQATCDWREFRVRARNGELIDSEWSNILMDDGTQIGIGIDIRPRKAAEENQAKLQQQLIQAQKLESIGNLAGGISHDFNNILTSILGYTEIALEEAGSNANLRKSLDQVFKAGLRARDLVQQILLFARQGDVEFKPIKVRTVLEEALGFLRQTIPTTVDIKTQLQSEALIQGNDTQLFQVIINICTNAAEAMENGGGTLRVCLDETRLGADLMGNGALINPGPYVRLEFSDTGTGIAPEALDAVLEPYFTTKESGKGTGLGLSVVHGIVRSFGGHLTVESELGKGSVFSIYLPMDPELVESDTSSASDLPRGTESILFVDDEEPIATMGRIILSSLGYRAESRTSSVEALELIKSRPEYFDLVISDMTMPNLTGDVLAREILKIKPEMPIIICTGYSRKISPESAKEAGVKGFTFKPLIKAELADTVRRVLDGQKDDTE